MFFTSPIGLGHITRDIAITDALIKLYDYDDFGFVTGSLAFDFISGENESRYNNKLSISNFFHPPHFSIIDGKLNNGFTWLLKYLRYYWNTKKIVRSFISNYIENSNLDLIISDEDLASLSIARDLGKKRIFITDILNTNFSKSFFSSKFEKLLNHSMCNLIKSTECVIIPESGEDFDNIYYVGPIVREIDQKRDQLRKKFGFEKKLY